MICGTLYFIRWQPKKLRSHVREFQWQVYATEVVTVGSTSHDASHEIGHRRFHPCDHVGTAPYIRAMRCTASLPWISPQLGNAFGSQHDAEKWVPVQGFIQRLQEISWTRKCLLTISGHVIEGQDLVSGASAFSSFWRLWIKGGFTWRHGITMSLHFLFH